MSAQGRKGWWLSYDVSVDGARLRVANILSGQAWRAQYSGFIAPALSADEVGELLDSCSELLGGGDSLLAVPWCESCFTSSSGHPLEAPAGAWVVT